MTEYHYNGYIIHPATVKLQTNEWNSEFYISKYENGVTTEKKFFPADTHPNRDEAIKFCIKCGISIIDDN
jgi:hypothetical protein